jgi:hypothetical protein
VAPGHSPQAVTFSMACRRTPKLGFASEPNQNGLHPCWRR